MFKRVKYVFIRIWKAACGIYICIAFYIYTMKINMDMLMIKICGLLFVIACLFAIDCYRQYRKVTAISNKNLMNTYTTAQGK